MNTTTQALPTTTAPSPRHGRKILAALAIIVALVGGSIAFAPGSAEASTGAHVNFCFKYSNGLGVSGPVTLYVWNGGWQPYRHGKSNSKGCGSFRDVHRHRYFTVAMNANFGSYDVCAYSRNGFVNIQGWTGNYVHTGGIGKHYVGRAFVQVTNLCV